MPRLPVRLSRSAYKPTAPDFAAGELQNMYIEAAEGDAAADYVLVSFPGLEAWVTAGSGNCRGLMHFGGRLYSVNGNTLQRISSNGTVTQMTGTISDDGNPVRFVSDLDELLIASDGKGYVLSGTTVTQVSDSDFPTVQDVSHLGSLAVAVSQDSGILNYSASGVFTDWGPLDFLSAEARPDDVVGVLHASERMWAFGERTTEAFHLVGGSAPIQRIRGLAYEVGCASRDSIQKVGSVPIWVDERGFVQRMSAEGPSRISTTFIEDQIRPYLSTLRAATFSFGGHYFYSLTAPGVLTYAFDTRTGGWVRLGGLGQDDYLGGFSEFVYGETVFADANSNQLYKLKKDFHSEGSGERRCVFTTEFVEGDGKTLTAGFLDLQLETGGALQSGQGSDPKIIMQYSDDAGRTWSNERLGSVHAVGNYNRRVRWGRLGRFTKRMFRFAFTDPIRLAALRAFIEVEASDV